MKKTFGFYSIIWAISLALFNAIVFINEFKIDKSNALEGAFWVGYVFITVAFVGELACAFFAFKPRERQRVFYNIPLVKISYAGLVWMLIAGSVCMTLDISIWIGIIICLLILTFNITALLKAGFAASAVFGIDERVTVKAFFVKSLTADAENLMNISKTAELKALAKKVYEAARYSDPMSNAALVEVEDKIQRGFYDFESAAVSEDLELALSTADELLSLIDIRNKKCKLLK